MITERDDEITKKEIVVEKTNNTENINIVCSKSKLEIAIFLLFRS